MEMLEIKNTVLQIKQSIDGFHGRLDSAKRRISKLRDRAIENFQTETKLKVN